MRQRIERDEFVPITPEDVVAKGVDLAVGGALLHGVFGTISKYSLSFFNPAWVATAGNFATFAGMGAIATPIAFGIAFLAGRLLDKNVYLKEHPVLKSSLERAVGLLLDLGSLTIAAAMLGTPFSASVLCVAVIPAMSCALHLFCNAINAFLPLLDEQHAAPREVRPV